MAKYRKIKDIADAWQFTKENYKKGVPDWLRVWNVSLWSQYGGDVIEGEIETIFGIMKVSENDYIVREEYMGLLVCNPFDFNMIYEKVED